MESDLLTYDLLYTTTILYVDLNPDATYVTSV